MKFILFTGFILYLISCKSKIHQVDIESVAIGLDGRQFFEPVRSTDQQTLLDKNLDSARKNFEENASENNYIWYGRRVGYLMHLKKAIDIYTEGIKKYPDSYKLYRHRGHRYISIRDFDKAVDDLSVAAKLIEGKFIETEPDGIPNKLNIPTSTTQFNIWYHLGLAYYLKAEYALAAAAYETCLKYADNDDSQVATSDWLYMTYLRAGRKSEAIALLDSIKPIMNIIENDSYHKRLLMYKGLYPSDSLLILDANAVDQDLTIATQGYGVANWYLMQDDTMKAKKIFNSVVSGKTFAAFGFIAAEADLVRLNKL